MHKVHCNILDSMRVSVVGVWEGSELESNTRKIGGLLERYHTSPVVDRDSILAWGSYFLFENVHLCSTKFGAGSRIE
jgi:hypothetical protein